MHGRTCNAHQWARARTAGRKNSRGIDYRRKKRAPSRGFDVVNAVLDSPPALLLLPFPRTASLMPSTFCRRPGCGLRLVHTVASSPSITLSALRVCDTSIRSSSLMSAQGAAIARELIRASASVMSSGNVALQSRPRTAAAATGVKICFACCTKNSAPCPSQSRALAPTLRSCTTPSPLFASIDCKFERSAGTRLFALC